MSGSRRSFAKRRRRQELQDDYSGGIESEIKKSHGFSGRKRNTIDSDSDDESGNEYNKKKFKVLEDDDIEGQEEQDDNVDYDGETKITPFNMKDEMEEGYFDGQGTYIWNKKDASEIKDNWLDSVDWMELKRDTKKDIRSQKSKDASTVNSDSESSSDYTELANKAFTVPYYRECLTFLKPGENILKAIKRHGGERTLSASDRLKQKKLAKLQSQGKAEIPETSTGVSLISDHSNLGVDRLTSIANKFLSLGDMDFYQETFESLTHKVENFMQSQNQPQPQPLPTAGLDMFSN